MSNSFEEEEKFVQMVHDFIESSEESESSSTSTKCFFSLHQNHQETSCRLTLQEILRSETEEAENEVLDCVNKNLRNRRDAQKGSSDLKKCLVRKLKTDGFNASLCQTCWSTSFGCPSGEYEYIDIVLGEEQNDHQEPTRLIVDIDFKSQFELARPTTTYRDLTNILPTIFVGKKEKLNKIITLLCSAAKQSLKERGLHLPPWRSTTYMRCKWLSDCQKFPAKNTPESNFDRSASNNRFKPPPAAGIGNISFLKKKKKKKRE